MTDPVPSKEWEGPREGQAYVLWLEGQVTGLRKQVEELSIHAEKWVKRALTHEREMPHCSTCACPPYDAEALKNSIPGCIHDSAPANEACAVCYPTQPPRDGQ